MMHRPCTQHNFSGRHPYPPSAKGKFLRIVKPLLAVLNIILLLSTDAPLALAQGRLTTYPDIMSFGNVAVGQSKAISMEIKNTGGASLVVSGQSVVGAGFSVSGVTLPLTLAVGATATFNVVFAPKAAGSVTGSLQLLNNTTIGPGVVTLYGAGTGGSTGSSGSSPTPAYLSANSLSAQFGSVPVGTQNTQVIALKNTGGKSLSISSIAAKGTGFAVTGFTTPIALAAGAQTQITVAFLPTTATSFSGSVAIASNASDSQITIVLTGTGTSSSQNLSVSPTSVAFGNVDVNGSETQQVTLKNTGNSSLTVSSAVISGTGLTASGVSNNTTLAPGQSAVLVADFAPKATGSVTGSIKIISNASNGASITVPVTGTGVSSAAHVVTLNWQASTTSGVIGYYVFRSSVSGGPYTQIVGSPVSGTTYSDSNVTAGAEYYYVVTAVNSNGSQSSYSNQVTATVP
jgi:HYDIN/CFA65/VesB family protein/ASPM-SPD-2-Hydin domain-containing protein